MLRCCGAILISFSLVVVLLFVSSSESSPIKSRNNQGIGSKNDNDLICNTPKCMKDAKYLIKNMNRSVDPCHDFYQYTCGGWIHQNPIRKGHSSLSVYGNLAQSKKSNGLENLHLYEKQTKFYKSCMNNKKREENGLTTLFNFLKILRGWPMAGVWPKLGRATSLKWKKGLMSLDNVIAVMTRLYGTGVLIMFHTLPADEMNPKLHRIYIDQPSFILPRDDLLNHENNPKYMAYRKLIIEVVKEFRNTQNLKLNDQIKTDVDDMLQFERKLAAITRSDNDPKDYKRMYNLMSITQLQELTDSVRTGEINWLNILNDIYTKGAGYTIENSEMVIVRGKCYLTKLVNLLYDYKNSTSTIDNYVHWRIVYSQVYVTNKKMRDLLFDFENVTSATKVIQTSLEKICQRLEKKLFRIFIERLYFDSNNVMTNSSIKMQVIEMIGNVKNAFISLVDDAKWLDDDTKTKVKNKVNLMVEIVGYPKRIASKAAMESYYSDLSGFTKDFVFNFRVANEFLMAKILKKLRMPYDRKDLDTFEFDYPYNKLTRNSINFPALIFQKPLFKPGRLAALNYGAIGAVIGHEVLHGVLGDGQKYNEFGFPHDWWTDDALNKYKEKSQCFVDQYANYTISDGTRLNGNISKEENMIDTNGLRAAFRAYKNYVKKDERKMLLPGLPDLNDEKLFFIGFASKWCGSESLESKQENILNGSEYTRLKSFVFSVHFQTTAISLECLIVR